MRCNIETIVSAMSIVREFNKLDLSKLELYEGGELIPITPECLEEWRFIGLSNSSFVDLEFWKNRCSSA